MKIKPLYNQVVLKPAEIKTGSFYQSTSNNEPTRVGEILNVGSDVKSPSLKKGVLVVYKVSDGNVFNSKGSYYTIIGANNLLAILINGKEN